ncbi:MAG: 5-(carboxyamino)imidazole ribonucleotide mutase [Clostridiales bacterium]|jgi:5-(carboxyamino)imidazole ribonucleotide mutase|nr:5-(carboxyamino)imidazole ribonucleotide mutase [Clostridiales bacterium]
MARVLVIMGSKSDLDVVRPAAQILKSLGIGVEVHALSAHRTPDEAAAYAKGERGRFDLFIAAAGKAAHLAGVIAAHTAAPVIGLPVKSSTLDGMDSLLSMVQMPPGVPVATVAINGGLNAGLLAAQILAVGDKALRDKLEGYKKKLADDVLADDAALQKEWSD